MTFHTNYELFLLLYCTDPQEYDTYVDIGDYEISDFEVYCWIEN